MENIPRTTALQNPHPVTYNWNHKGFPGEILHTAFSGPDDLLFSVFLPLNLAFEPPQTLTTPQASSGLREGFGNGVVAWFSSHDSYFQGGIDKF